MVGGHQDHRGLPWYLRPLRWLSRSNGKATARIPFASWPEQTHIMRTALPCLAVTFLFATQTQAQDIPNGGFENWTNQGDYIDPDGWLTSNMVSWSLANMLTCEQGSPGVVGAHFVKVTDRLLIGAGMQQASITVGQWGSFPAFPYTGRPDALNGFWQYHPMNGGSDGVVNAALTRWNSVTHQREYIANAPIHATGDIGDWEAFSSPFLYYSDEYPDSAIVSIQATSATAGDATSIWVDELSFGNVQGVKEMQAPVLFTLWPSPATDQLHIDADRTISEVLVQDVCGRVMSAASLTTATAMLEVGDLSAGVYLAQVRFADGRRAVSRFTKE